MKEVIFKSISIKNFLSIGDEAIDIKIKPGIHTITGINKDKEDSKNGVGKSTISDAFFFAIFGSPLRPIKKEVITNWINKKDCSVTICFDVINDGQTSEYILVRSLNPSRVQLIKNGEDVSRTIGKTNETIYDILGTTPEMFEQSVIMCLNQVEPFLAKTPAVKRKFIEDIFKIEIFGRMSQYMRTDFTETKRLYDAEIEKISDIEANIQVYKRQQQEQIEKRKIRLNELDARRVSITDEITHLQKQVSNHSVRILPGGCNNKDDLLPIVKQLKNKEKEIIELDKQYIKVLATNQTTVLNIRSKIKELTLLSDGVCAYCKQPFTESSKQEKKDLITQYLMEIKECERIIEETNERIKQSSKQKNIIEDQIEEYNQKLREIEACANEIIRIESEIKQQERWLSQVNADISTADKENNSFTDIILELTTRCDTLTAATSIYKEKMSLIESSKFIVSDEGVKNSIVKKMLKMLNGRLNYYLKQLDANCSCKFNEYFDETIINNRGRECSYFNFSGGERKRIDLAMLFTFMDIRRLQSNISVNFGIYDELLDTSLDAKGIECTLNILKERVLNNNEAIYVISHKSEAAKHATGEIIYLEKENDITRRRPYE